MQFGIPSKNPKLAGIIPSTFIVFFYALCGLCICFYFLAATRGFQLLTLTTSRSPSPQISAPAAGSDSPQLGFENGFPRCRSRRDRCQAGRCSEPENSRLPPGSEPYLLAQRLRHLESDGRNS